MVKAPPFSSIVRGAKRAFVQSALEKKSASILKEPQSVQTKGNAAIISQKTTNTDIEIQRVIYHFALFSLKSRQVLTKTGSKSIETPIIVNTEDVAAEESNLVSPPKSLKINQERDWA